MPNQITCIDLPRGYDPPRWCPENSSEEYGEIVTLEYALANSMNTVTAKLIKTYGTERVLKLARALGIESDIPNVPSIALGSAAYAKGASKFKCSFSQSRSLHRTYNYFED